MIYKFFAFLFCFSLAFGAMGQSCAIVSSEKEIVKLNPNITIWNEATNEITPKKALEIQKKGAFVDLNLYTAPKQSGAQWLHFKLRNEDDSDHDLKFSLAFVDKADYYFWIDSALTHIKSGDLIPPSERNVAVGQMCFVGMYLPARKTAECLLRVESKTDISEQFRELALRSLQVYTERPFTQQFVTSRIYQAAFYGAIIVMLLYNSLIFATTRSASYASYVGFLSVLIIFMASNSGYLAELFLDQSPRFDLYLRFVSAPLLLIAFIVFARHYLESKKYAPRFDTILTGLGIFYAFILLLMFCGYWKMGRTMVIVTAPISFVVLLISAIVIQKRGYTPALYFLIANLLLIIGASFFAFERYNFVVQNQLTQYSIQLAVVFQAVFFSIGLADRIKLVQKQISTVQLENEKLEKLRESERKKLIEDKNVALEESNKVLDAFIYKTAHDIRGPIARLMGLSNLGILDVQDAKSLEYFHMLKNNSHYLSYLINRLSVAYEIRNKTVTKQSFDLPKLLGELLKELSYHEGYQDVYFNIKINELLFIYSDKELIRFILTNLMDNAVKFKQGNVGADKLPIDMNVSIESNRLIIKIEENGIGVREEEVPFLFEMFSKAAGKYKSPGLGMYMAKICAEKLGGTITLLHASKPTIFKVEIPL